MQFTRYVVLAFAAFVAVSLASGDDGKKDKTKAATPSAIQADLKKLTMFKDGTPESAAIKAFSDDTVFKPLPTLSALDFDETKHAAIKTEVTNIGAALADVKFLPKAPPATETAKVAIYDEAKAKLAAARAAVAAKPPQVPNITKAIVDVFVYCNEKKADIGMTDDDLQKNANELLQSAQKILETGKTLGGDAKTQSEASLKKWEEYKSEAGWPLWVWGLLIGGIVLVIVIIVVVVVVVTKQRILVPSVDCLERA